MEPPPVRPVVVDLLHRGQDLGTHEANWKFRNCVNAHLAFYGRRVVNMGTHTFAVRPVGSTSELTVTINMSAVSGGGVSTFQQKADEYELFLVLPKMHSCPRKATVLAWCHELRHLRKSNHETCVAVLENALDQAGGDWDKLQKSNVYSACAKCARTCQLLGPCLDLDRTLHASNKLSTPMRNRQIQYRICMPPRALTQPLLPQST
jgi:hypothetical protein